MVAIVRTGGKQYLVAVGDKLKVEKIEAAADAEIQLETLFVGDESQIQVGTPVLATSVVAKVIGSGRKPKVTGMKHKAKKRELTRYGHRQAFTEVEITTVA